jgi:hypothetical protein
LQNQSIEPKVDNLWNALFSEGTSTPLQTLMIKVNKNKAITPVTKNLTKIFLTNHLSNQEHSMQQEPTLSTSRTDLKDMSRSYVI